MARLVEAEIVSPYHGNLINMGVGNPIVPSTWRLGNKQVCRASGEAQDPCCLYKEIRIPPSHPRLLLPLLIPPRSPTPKLSPSPQEHSKHVRCGRQVDGLLHQEGRHQETPGGGYLCKDITHRLPAKGQVVPTPEPHKRVVFLHPFVRGLMFYYGLDFHDLAPNFILNISAFIVV